MYLIPILRKNLTNFACQHRIPGSLSLRLVTTSTEESLVTSPAILDLLLHKYRFTPQLAVTVATALNGVRAAENSDSILSFLKEIGFSNAQLEKIVKHRPQYLLSSLEGTIKPKVRAFQDLGFCSDDVVQIMSKNPTMFMRNFNTTAIHSLSVLKGLLRSDAAVVELLRRFALFLFCDLERTLVPNVEFLKSCGIPVERIIRFLHHAPLSLLLKPEVIRKSVEKAERMGAKRSSNMFVYAVQVCTATDEAWEIKWQAFRNCGFSESDVMTMFQKSPQIFGISVEKITRLKGFLLATGKFSISCIVNNPVSFTYSIEKRYNPRFQVLEILERKNLIKYWPSLASINRLSDKQFFGKFVGPYPSELGDVYLSKISPMAKRENEPKTLH